MGLKTRIPLRPGIYCPTLTFFDPQTEDLDLPTIGKHSVRLARAGLVGLVTLGSNGEAVHLSRSEKAMVTHTTRNALDEAGYTKVPVICGAAEQSVRGTLDLCREGAEAGADYALLVPPSYYRPAMVESRLEEYYTAVADESPIPILLYNYPGAVAGIDMDSDFITRISQHPNIVGTKFTCGNVGKLTRVASAMDACTPKKNGSGFMALGGLADFTLQAGVSGGSGIVSGGANVIPKMVVKVWDLWCEGKIEEAMKLQEVLSKGDWLLGKPGVPGTKAALQRFFGYGGFARRPLKKFNESETEGLAGDLEEIIQMEKDL
ncbi:4-hydroxy-2-oxoglutarate aldolase, partial [Lecanoromycetidae sp. Uapishka_2]